MIHFQLMMVSLCLFVLWLILIALLCFVIVPSFIDRNLSDFGHDVIDFQTFTWNLSSWSKLERRIQSPIFNVGGHPWLVFYLHL